MTRGPFVQKYCCLLDRLKANCRIDETDPNSCWLWKGVTRGRTGDYPRVNVRHEGVHHQFAAHRLSKALDEAGGDLGLAIQLYDLYGFAGFELDHECERPSCIRPGCTTWRDPDDHLELTLERRRSRKKMKVDPALIIPASAVARMSYPALFQHHQKLAVSLGHLAFHGFPSKESCAFFLLVQIALARSMMNENVEGEEVPMFETAREVAVGNADLASTIKRKRGTFVPPNGLPKKVPPADTKVGKLYAAMAREGGATMSELEEIAGVVGRENSSERVKLLLRGKLVYYGWGHKSVPSPEAGGADRFVVM